MVLILSIRFLPFSRVSLRLLNSSLLFYRSCTFMALSSMICFSAFSSSLIFWRRASSMARSSFSRARRCSRSFCLASASAYLAYFLWSLSAFFYFSLYFSDIPFKFFCFSVGSSITVSSSGSFSGVYGPEIG